MRDSSFISSSHAFTPTSILARAFIGIAKIYDRSVLLMPGGFINMIGCFEDRSRCARNRISVLRLGGVRYFDLLDTTARGSPRARKKSFLRRHVVTGTSSGGTTLLFVICYVDRLVTTGSKSLRSSRHCPRQRGSTLSLSTRAFERNPNLGFNEFSDLIRSRVNCDWRREKNCSLSHTRKLFEIHSLPCFTRNHLNNGLVKYLHQNFLQFSIY